MYKLIIFDLDGTLLNTSLTIQSVINESLKKFSLPPLTVEQTKEFVGNGARKLVERAVGKADVAHGGDSASAVFSVLDGAIAEKQAQVLGIVSGQ